MAVFNHGQKEINAKIVYCGPGVSGKTTNLQFIHQNMKPEQRGKIVSLATNQERTLFFDFLPIELDSLRGFKTRFHLYTVPGQVYYSATRRAVLLGVDGVIFVADSQADKMEDNLISFKDLEENLRYYGKRIETIPLIIQYNKRDLANILTLEELNQKINRLNVPYFEAVAMRGKGVFETLTMACRTVLKGIETGAETRKIPGKKPEPVLERPAGGATALPPEKDGLSPGPKPVIPGQALAREPGPGKEVPSLEVPRPGSEPRRVGVKFEEEKTKPISQAAFSGVSEKVKPEPGPQLGEKAEKNIPEFRGKLRIIFCGQPQIFSPGSLKIPLDVEDEGSGKIFSFNLAVNIEKGFPKI